MSPTPATDQPKAPQSAPSVHVGECGSPSGERVWKKAILHRKNALFFKTENGAHVGDVFLSLIHTAELNGVNPFDYLTELLRHARDARDAADEWMPWNYRRALQPTA